MVEARNVFDSEKEFNRLRDAVISSIDEFSESRGGNVTYGEIIFVLESIIEEFGSRCDPSEASGESVPIDKMTRASQLRFVLAEVIHLLSEKGIISREEEEDLCYGA
ncbi:MAG: hypothetical protein JW941_05225 [Candidatus Coatesbacteria bacterium]|nr:hypothetical protein [Candidatus Coatesbacteria bacterium]